MDGKMRIGWIGVGKMGAPMSRRVREAGFPLTVRDPSQENVDAAVSSGAVEARDMAALARDSDVICLTIPNDQTLRQAILGENDGLLAHLRPHHVVVEMSTVSPAVSAEVATALATKQVGYLRAPVSGSTATAAAGKLTVLASGPSAAFDACRPLFESFAAKLFHLGEGEEARSMKLVLNAMVAATSALVAEALAVGRKGGLDSDTMMDVIAESVVASPLLAYKRDLVVSGDYAPQFTVAQMMKDVDLILDEGRRTHVPLPLVSLIRQRYETAYNTVHAERDFFALVAMQQDESGERSDSN